MDNIADTRNEKINYVITKYLTKCTCNRLYINGKPNPEYYKLRNYIIKNIHRFPLGVCYDFARTLEKKREPMSLKDFVNRAKAYRELCLSEQDRVEREKLYAAGKIPEQRKFTLEDLMNL